MLSFDPQTIVVAVVVAVAFVATDYLVVTRPKEKRTVAALKARLSERLEQSLGDVKRYEAKAALGVAGYIPGGNVSIVKVEFHDWFEGFLTALQHAVPFSIREELRLHTYDDMLLKIDPNHSSSLWSQELKIRANRW